MTVPTLLTGTGDFTETTYASANTFVGGKPTNTVNGDYLLAEVYTRNGAADFTAPSGWSALPGALPGSTVGILRLYGLPVTDAAGLPASWTWTTTNGSSRSAVRISRVTGVDLAAPLDSSGAYATGLAASLTLPSVTTVAADVLLLAPVTVSTTSGAAQTAVPPGSMTEQYEPTFGSASTSSMALATESRPTAGATGSRVFSYTGTVQAAAGYLVGLKGISAPSNAPPTVNAGADQPNVEPWSPVTLTFSATDTDGTVTGYNVTQTGGVPVVLSAPTINTRIYEAPGTIAGDTQTFSVTATDDDGAVSTPATVSVTVLPVTERAVIGGVEVPMRVRLM